MTPLSTEQKQLLFDYCLGLTSDEQTAQAEALISANPQASDLRDRLKASISPLDAATVEPCPYDLLDKTVARLKQANSQISPSDRLAELLTAEQARTVRISPLRNFGDLVAVAAVVMLVASVLVPTLGHARQLYWEHKCRLNLGSVFQGLHSYMADYDDCMPAVPRDPGDPWWKVGYQGRENYSNTRPVWLLVRKQYVDPKRFNCPARRVTRVRLDNMQVELYNDFPSKSHISFSFRLCCETRDRAKFTRRQVVMADMNPLSEKMPDDHDQPFRIELSEEILNFNSANHNRRGQNVMFCDGSVEFTKNRLVGDAQDDDIFSLTEMQCGDEVTGCETPSNSDDAFLVP